MKKLLLFKKMIIVILLAGISSAGWAQVLLYEGFNYNTPAYIGGNGDVGTSSNNWITHSVTGASSPTPVPAQTTTIDIQDGSLSYTGLSSSVGNKVYMFGDANATSRDVDRGFTTTAKVAYYSALINIVDNSQVVSTNLDKDVYFMHFSTVTGGVSNNTFGGRLGARAVGTPTTNFRFIISNISGGTPTYSDNGADLNFGTAYLVVVKYDISAPLTAATMWVNPVTLGGAEAVGGVSNSSGTGTSFTSFATGSICLRNSGATPKANIDEIRVGATFADVTPVGGNVGISKKDQASRQTSIYPNPAKSFFNVKAPEGDYQVSINNSIGSLVKYTELNSTGKIDLSDLRPGIYYVTVENERTNAKEVHKLIVR